jgi:hypothetical protein
LVLAFPGPVILVEGMANLFRKRTELGGTEPNFHALMVIEPGKDFLAGLDARYRFRDGGELMDIHGSAEAFYSFKDPGAWFINIGIDQPIERRIGARIFQLFDVNGFLMLNAHSLALGAGWRYDEKFGFKHLFVRLFASMEGRADVSWHPTHFTGSIGLEGGAEACAFGICTGLSVGASIAGDVFDPFGLRGTFDVSLDLPWPLPNISKSITLSWEFDFSDQKGPAVPVPLREMSVEHLKSGNTWPFLRGKSLRADDGAGGQFEFERPGGQVVNPVEDLSAPFAADLGAPRIPADSKVAITFNRPTSDPLPIAQASTDVSAEQIGDPHPGKGAAYTVGYTLDGIELQKWAPGGEGTDGAPRWTTVLQGGPGPDESERLIGEWVPGHEDPNQGHSEQHKLLLNAVTPFDYTASRSSTWEQAFLSTHPGYPCPLVVPELSARFGQEFGTFLDAPFTFAEPMPAFQVSWGYGGEIAESDEVVSTILGPIDRGVRVASGGTITPPPGTRAFVMRVGQPKQLSSSLGELISQLGKVGNVPNPVSIGDGIVRAFDGLREPRTLRSQNRVVQFSAESRTGLEIGDRLEIEILEPAALVEIELELAALFSPRVDVFAVLANGVELAHQSPPVGSSTLRFHSSGGSLIVQVIIQRGSKVPWFGALKRVSARYPLQVYVRREGMSETSVVEANGVLAIDDLGSPIINVNIPQPGTGLLLLELFLPAADDVLMRRVANSLNRLKREDPLFEPEADYRFVVATNRDDKALGDNSGSVLTHNRDHINHAYFHVVGPPGIGTPDLPPNQNLEAKAGLALDDLRLYVEQTLPPSIPSDGGKLLLPRAFYRGYDVAVKFNVAHAELLYLRSRRDLSVRLYDVENAPVLSADGRVAVPVPSWERSRQQSLTDSVALWIAAVNQSACRPEDIPPFDASTVVRPQVLSGPGEDVLLAPETLHHAHLVPALLHEAFVAPLPGLLADGGSHRLERWVAEGASRWVIDSEIINDPLLGSVTVFFVKEESGSTSSLHYAGPLNLADGPDAPTRWSDFRASVLIRWGAGAVGLELRRNSGSDLLRVTLDRSFGERRLLRIAGGSTSELASDSTSFPNANTDVLVTVECLGSRVQVFQDDELIFDEDAGSTSAGTVSLYTAGASPVRFTEVRVDDLRPTPSTAFVFDFVTSKYSNFYHHLHSFPDQLIEGASGTALSATDIVAHIGNSISLPASGAASGLGGVPDDEWRSFDMLAAKALGPAVLQTPESLEILRVSETGAPLVLLVRSPEPLLWERTLLEVFGTSDAGTHPIPGDLKLTDVTFGASPADESVTVLVRHRRSLAGHRLEWRRLPDSGNSDASWNVYYAFGATEPELADGTQVHLLPLLGTEAEVPQREPGSVQRFTATSADPSGVHFSVPGVEVRLLAPDRRTVVHQRAFPSPDSFSSFPMHALRKLDGTAFLLLTDSLVIEPATLRLSWTFNRAVGDEDLRFRQGGSETPEQPSLDFKLVGNG